VTRVESLRPGAGPNVALGDDTFAARLWRETLETRLEPLATFADGGPAWVGDGRWSYLATWPEQPLMDAIVERLARAAGLFVAQLEEGVRMRSRDGVAFAFNYAAETRTTPAPPKASYLLGGAELPPAGVAAWRLE